MNSTFRLACLAAASFCAFAPPAYTQSSNADWIADSHGCKVANPQPQSIESISWSGRCKDGFADGAGTVSWFSEGRANGRTAGTFRQGKLTGKGSVTLPHAVYPKTKFSAHAVDAPRSWLSGARLEGEFLDNELVGDGTITKPDGKTEVVHQVDGKLVRKALAAPRGAAPRLPRPQ